jgi:drug/metabolite transporter (DMT)-like permease
MHVLENGVLIAAVANAVVGLTLVWDKVLLKQTSTKSVINYVFWLGAISIFGCIIGVFGMRKPSVGMLLIACGAGAVDLLASYVYYKALQAGEASQTLAVMGGFAPLATALIGVPLLHERMRGPALGGFGLLVASGFFMFASHRMNVRKILPLVLLASGLFGLANVTQKMTFDALGFTTGFVFFCIGQFVFALCFLLRKKWRDQIFRSSKGAAPSSKVGYFVNRFFNGVGAFLLAFAISKAHPALVSALSGVRYAAIFLGAYFLTKYKPKWLREAFTGWPLTAKVIATGLVIAGLAVLGISGNAGQSGTATLFLCPR